MQVIAEQKDMERSYKASHSIPLPLSFPLLLSWPVTAATEQIYIDIDINRPVPKSFASALSFVITGVHLPIHLLKVCWLHTWLD